MKKQILIFLSKSLFVLIVFMTVNMEIIYSQDCNPENYDEVWYVGDQVIQNYYDKKILVMNYITIKQSVLIDNCELTFAEGAGIELAEKHFMQNSSILSPLYNVTLTIQNNSHLKGCNKMWKGIKANICRNILGTSSYKCSNSYLKIYNSTIEDAEIGIDIVNDIPTNVSAKYENEIALEVSNVVFQNDYIGIKGNFDSRYLIKNCTFDYSGFLPAYTNQLNYGNSPYTGILNQLGSCVLNNKNYFRNLDNGIVLESQDISKKVSIRNNEFANISQIGIKVRDYKNVSCELNLFSDVEKSIDVTSKNLLTLLKLDKNTIIGGASSIEIYDTDFENVSINRNNITDSELGINILDVAYNNLVLDRNTINANIGLLLTNTKAKSNRSSKIIDNYFDKNGYSMVLDNSSFNTVNRNIIVNHLSSRSTGIWCNNKSTDNYFLSNIVEIVGNRNFNIDQSSVNFMCCNILNGGREVLKVEGTNSMTQVRGTKLSGELEALFNRSAIGTQIHGGNRWIGSETTAELRNASVANNSFLVNFIETNEIDGRIRPEFTIPNFLSTTWFSNESNGFSTLCEPNANCGIALPSVSNDFPIEEDALIPLDEPCYPNDIDTDRDGICDNLDPDANDSCIPQSNDLDGDGICDFSDPDPLDPCIPLGLDTDGDGICDTADSEPYNPCEPNFIDTDLDGLCDNIDPEYQDNTMPFDWVPIVEDDYEIDIAGEIVPVTPKFSSIYHLSLLEESTSFSFDSSYSGIINNWENQAEIMKFLKKNPYYRKISNVLDSFYSENNNQILNDYVNAEIEMENIKSINSNNSRELILYYLNLDRLSRLKELYSIDTIVEDSIIQMIGIKLNELKTQIENIEAENNIIQEHKLTLINNLVNSLGENMHFSIDRKITWELILKKEKYGLESLVSDSATLIYIANKCPLEFGTAVKDAQQLLISLNLRNYEDFENNCLNNQIRSSSNNNDYNLIAYPNPGIGIFHFRISDVKSIRITDIGGKEIDKSTFMASQYDNIYTLKFNEIPLGIYFVDLKLFTGVNLYSKIILVK
ncbi:MAG TPA: hypothetical protein PLQ57_05290 [Saprospiraceae bacterium]|nr:hypothetical protein [Saprospiraceae bacterium]